MRFRTAHAHYPRPDSAPSKHIRGASAANDVVSLSRSRANAAIMFPFIQGKEFQRRWRRGKIRAKQLGSLSTAFEFKMTWYPNAFPKKADIIFSLEARRKDVRAVSRFQAKMRRLRTPFPKAGRIICCAASRSRRVPRRQARQPQAPARSARSSRRARAAAPGRATAPRHSARYARCASVREDWPPSQA